MKINRCQHCYLAKESGTKSIMFCLKNGEKNKFNNYVASNQCACEQFRNKYNN